MALGRNPKGVAGDDVHARIDPSDGNPHGVSQNFSHFLGIFLHILA